jgi:hypothetical protein
VSAHRSIPYPRNRSKNFPISPKHARLPSKPFRLSSCRCRPSRNPTTHPSPIISHLSKRQPARHTATPSPTTPTLSQHQFKHNLPVGLSQRPCDEDKVPHSVVRRPSPASAGTDGAALLPTMALTATPPVADRKRVKVYELKNNDWFDRGTGFCTGSLVNVSLNIHPLRLPPMHICGSCDRYTRAFAPACTPSKLTEYVKFRMRLEYTSSPRTNRNECF